MTTTVSVPVEIEIVARVHPIEGGGYWAEVPLFPGCVTQVDCLDDLQNHLARAIRDWLSDERVMSAEESQELRRIQERRDHDGAVTAPIEEELSDRLKALAGETEEEQGDSPNPFIPPPGWIEDEDE